MDSNRSWRNSSAQKVRTENRPWRLKQDPEKDQNAENFERSNSVSSAEYPSDPGIHSHWLGSKTPWDVFHRSFVSPPTISGLRPNDHLKILKWAPWTWLFGWLDLVADTPGTIIDRVHRRFWDVPPEVVGSGNQSAGGRQGCGTGAGNGGHLNCRLPRYSENFGVELWDIFEDWQLAVP